MINRQFLNNASCITEPSSQNITRFIFGASLNNNRKIIVWSMLALQTYITKIIFININGRFEVNFKTTKGNI